MVWLIPPLVPFLASGGRVSQGRMLDTWASGPAVVSAIAHRMSQLQHLHLSKCHPVYPRTSNNGSDALTTHASATPCTERIDRLVSDWFVQYWLKTRLGFSHYHDLEHGTGRGDSGPALPRLGPCIPLCRLVRNHDHAFQPSCASRSSMFRVSCSPLLQTLTTRKLHLQSLRTPLLGMQ